MAQPSRGGDLAATSWFQHSFGGHHPNARKPIGPADIRWADVIFVMERKHEHRLRAEYARLLEHKQLHVLDIPDDYRFMDPELVDMLEREVTAYLCI